LVRVRSTDASCHLPCVNKVGMVPDVSFLHELIARPIKATPNRKNKGALYLIDLNCCKNKNSAGYYG
jgi:hypothetical protein